jgi:hypothetical protein
MLSVFAMRDARQIVRDDLKRRNCKPSHYAQAEISRMALNYLNEGRWAEFKALALAKIMSSPKLKAEWDREGLRYETAMAKRQRPVCVLPRTSI